MRGTTVFADGRSPARPAGRLVTPEDHRGWRTHDDLSITAGPYTFRARLEEERAPKTCAAFTQLLPFAQKVIHVRWSGESAWIPLGEFEVGVGFENHTSHPAPGEILLYPGGFSETEILLPYGGCLFASIVGQLAGNHFLTVVEGNENLRALGEMPVGGRAGHRVRPANEQRRARPGARSRGVVEKRRVEAVAGELDERLVVELQRLGDPGEVLADVAAEVGGVVGVDGGAQSVLEHRRERVLLERVDDPQLDVRERADGQRDPIGLEPLNQATILQAAHAVIDPLGAEQVERLPDVLGRALLAGVGDGPEPRAIARSNTSRNFSGGLTHLGGVEPDAEDRVPVRERLLERRHRVVGRQIAQEAHDQVRADPELPRLGQGPTDSAHHRLERDAARGMGLRVEEDLDVTNALCAGAGQVGDRELVEIPFVDEHRARPVVDVQERLQVAEAVGAPDRLRVRVREPDAVAPASSNISSGSSVPSMCRCNSALGNVNGSIGK